MIMQRDGKVEVPQEEDLYSFGTVVKVKQMLQLPGGLIRIQAEGISRIRVHSVLRKENCLVSRWRMCRKSSRRTRFVGKHTEGPF